MDKSSLLIKINGQNNQLPNLRKEPNNFLKTIPIINPYNCMFFFDIWRQLINSPGSILAVQNSVPKIQNGTLKMREILIVLKEVASHAKRQMTRWSYNLHTKYVLRNIPRKKCKCPLPLYRSKPAWFQKRLHLNSSTIAYQL